MVTMQSMFFIAHKQLFKRDSIFETKALGSLISNTETMAVIPLIEKQVSNIVQYFLSIFKVLAVFGCMQISVNE